MNLFEGGRRVTKVAAACVPLLLFYGGVSLETLGACLVWIGSLFGVSWVVGWVVRGTMGIPSGMDEKPMG